MIATNRSLYWHASLFLVSAARNIHKEVAGYLNKRETT